MTTLLAQGIAAAHAGRREEARTLLMQVITEDERNIDAWTWMAGVVDDPEDMRVCLDNVLHLEPNNQRAQQGLAWIDKTYGPRPEPTPEPEPEREPQKLEPEPVHVIAPTPPASATTQPISTTSAPSLVDAPCPYCGTRVELNLTRCPQCRHSLLAPVASATTHGGWAMTMLAFLWILPMIIALVVIVVAWIASSTLRGGNGLGSLSFLTIGFAMTFAILLVVSLPVILIARGLYLRRKWAFIIATFFTLLSFISNMLQINDIFLMLRDATGAYSQAEMFVNSVTTGVAVLLTLGQIALLYIGSPSVFGDKQRLVYEVTPTDAGAHYNNGIALREKGMWYAAALEWEAASARSPREAEYLHVLGLAYAQLRQFERARNTLARANTIAPNDGRIGESQRLVEQLAQA